MPQLEIDPSQFEGLLWSDHPDLPAKLGRFALATPDETHQIFDADGCMTTDELDSWGVATMLQTPLGKERDELLNSIFYPTHKTGRMKDYEAVLWWTLTLDNFIDNFREDVGLEDISEAGKAMEARDGLVEHFELLERLGIPSVVMSAGIKNPIDAFLAKYNLRPKVVMANEFTLSEEGKITYSNQDLIHINNKQEKAHGNGEIEELRRTRPYIFVVGDGSKDPRMAGTDTRNVLSIRTSMPQDLTPRQQISFFRRSIREGYDAISLDGSFRPIHRATGALALYAA
jgi:2-hydroxy-3-keto-5-methylthiopentenyl-1-phosphate phosphatase